VALQSPGVILWDLMVFPDNLCGFILLVCLRHLCPGAERPVGLRYASFVAMAQTAQAISEGQFLEVLDELSQLEKGDDTALLRFSPDEPLAGLSVDELYERFRAHLHLDQDQVKRLIRLGGLQAAGPDLARLASAALAVAGRAQPQEPPAGTSKGGKGKGRGKRSATDDDEVTMFAFFVWYS